STAHLLQHWGVEVGFLAGHSTGEVPLTEVSGICDLQDASKLAAIRSNCIKMLNADNGRILVISHPEKSCIVQKIISNQEEIEIACFNCPNQTVLSGSNHRICYLQSTLKETGYNVALMPHDYAAHSKLQANVATVMKSLLNGIEFRNGTIPIANNLDGKLVMALDGNYFCEQVMKTVQFSECVRTLNANAVDCYIEVGADSVLINFRS